MTHDSKELRPTVTDTQQSLTPEMVRLILAARHVAFVDQEFESLHELDEASEAFAKVVPWDDDPNDEVDAPPAASPTDPPKSMSDLEGEAWDRGFQHGLEKGRAAPPKPAPDAMREALRPFAEAADAFDSWVGRTKRPDETNICTFIPESGQLLDSATINYGHCRKARAALSAPVPPPDGAAEPREYMFSERKLLGGLKDWIDETKPWLSEKTAPSPSDDVRSALADKVGKDLACTRTYSMKEWSIIETALCSAPVSAPATLEALAKDFEGAEHVNWTGQEVADYLRHKSASPSTVFPDLGPDWTPPNPAIESMFTASAPASPRLREAIARIINPKAFGAEYWMKDRMHEQQYAMTRADAILALSPAPDATVSDETEDGAEIIFLDAAGEQHRIIYDINEDQAGLGSGWFLHEDDPLASPQHVGREAAVSADEREAIRDFVAQLIVSTARGANITIREQPFPARVFDRVLAVASGASAPVSARDAVIEAINGYVHDQAADPPFTLEKYRAGILKAAIRSLTGAKP